MAKESTLYKLEGSTRGTTVVVDSIDIHKGTVTFHDTKSGKSSTVKAETFDKNYSRINSPAEPPKKHGKAPAKPKEIGPIEAAKERDVKRVLRDLRFAAAAAKKVETGPTLRNVPEKHHVDTYIRVAGTKHNVVSAKQNGRVRIFDGRCDAEQAKEIVAQLGAIRGYLMSEFKLDEKCIKEYIESTLA